MSEKLITLRPETIPDVQFPGMTSPQTSSQNKNSIETFYPEKTPEASFPKLNIAHATISQSINTQSQRILGAFSFGQSGAIQIGKYVSGTSGDVRISPNGIVGRNSSGINTFTIDATTGNASFLGTVYATAGSIGGFTIQSSYLSAGSGSNVAGMSPSDYPFWAGASYSSRGSAPFRVTPAGAVVASNVDITGKITATSGAIAGWDVTASTLSKNGVILDSGGLILVGNANDNISMLVSTVPVVSFMIGGAVKGLLKATTAGAGGVAVVGGDLVIDNNKSILLGSSGGYGGISITSSHDFWLTLGSNNKFYMKNFAQDDNYFTVSDTTVYAKGKFESGSNQIKLGSYTLTLNGNVSLP